MIREYISYLYFITDNIISDDLAWMRIFGNDEFHFINTKKFQNKHRIVFEK